MSLSNEIAVAVAHALGYSLPAIISAVQENTAAMSSVPPINANVNSGSAVVVASSLASSSGTLRLPAFVSTSLYVPAITGFNPSRGYVHFPAYGDPCDQRVFRFGRFRFLTFLR